MSITTISQVEGHLLNHLFIFAAKMLNRTPTNIESLTQAEMNSLETYLRNHAHGDSVGLLIAPGPGRKTLDEAAADALVQIRNLYRP